MASAGDFKAQMAAGCCVEPEGYIVIASLMGVEFDG
jgi:hypothetical protein